MRPRKTSKEAHGYAYGGAIIQDMGYYPHGSFFFSDLAHYVAKNLSLKVTAEGVENQAQMSFLRLHQCDEIQGYYFSKPLAADKVADKLRADYPEVQIRAQASAGKP